MLPEVRVRLESSGNSQGCGAGPAGGQGTTSPPCKKLLWPRGRCEKKNKHWNVGKKTTWRCLICATEQKYGCSSHEGNSILRKEEFWSSFRHELWGWACSECHQSATSEVDSDSQSSPLLLRACNNVETQIQPPKTTPRTSFSPQENSKSKHALCQEDSPEMGSHPVIFQPYSSYCWGAAQLPLEQCKPSNPCFNTLCYCTSFSAVTVGDGKWKCRSVMSTIRRT